MARLRIRVVPGASRTEVVGWLGEAIKVRVAAPPEEGAANRALLAHLAERAGLGRSQARLVSGAGSRDKVVELDGLSEAEARTRLVG